MVEYKAVVVWVTKGDKGSLSLVKTAVGLFFFRVGHFVLTIFLFSLVKEEKNMFWH